MRQNPQQNINHHRLRTIHVQDKHVQRHIMVFKLLHQCLEFIIRVLVHDNTHTQPLECEGITAGSPGGHSRANNGTTKHQRTIWEAGVLYQPPQCSPLALACSDVLQGGAGVKANPWCQLNVDRAAYHGRKSTNLSCQKGV